MEKNYKDDLILGLEKINVEYDDEKIKKCLAYINFLLAYNQKINLTAIKNPHEIILKHFLDSLAILNFIEIKNFKVIDIGTGAGFPGVPIKIFCPEIELTLWDSIEKKIKFLSLLKNELGLQKVNCINTRAEDFVKKNNERENYDLCVSRAVAKLNVLSEICLPFVKLNGFFVAYKGFEIEDEFSKAKNCIKKLGGGKINIKDVNIFDNENKNFIRHKLIFVTKLFHSESKFPRDYVKILKKPL